ncbi:transporter substrate-binding domain-containing protein [Roseobacter sp. N2S]|uniref:transporter substrate-binding domain-containing protein n=1 Tax=Roseobacter sp. N2S TaxID=2663844 RepID=UPI00285EE7B4|nr:transporter substrate-binding domain-containing protein [Roseobacter sp. N2S]MDR6266927.1 polar amino acid transport system substrate-binding protein [Roseobacter sp. N2S]
MTIKTLMTAAFTAAVLGAGAVAADPVKIGIAAEPYPPFASVDAAGTWNGWEVDIINAVCAAEKMDCVITPVAWDGIIPSLTAGTIDAIMASMSITEERQKTIDFSDAYYDTPTVIVADKSSDIEPNAASLKGKIIGVQASTVHQAYVNAHFSDAGEIRVYQTQDEANQDLVAGRIDATQADSIAMADFVGSDGGACCEIKGSVPDDTAILGLGVGAGVRKGDDALREQLNAGIKTILDNGTHAEITAKYFKTSIYKK